MSQRLGDLLVKEKIITPEQLEQANKTQKEQSCRLALGPGEVWTAPRMRMSQISSPASTAFPQSIFLILKLTLPSSS